MIYRHWVIKPENYSWIFTISQGHFPSALLETAYFSSMASILKALVQREGRGASDSFEGHVLWNKDPSYWNTLQHMAVHQHLDRLAWTVPLSLILFFIMFLYVSTLQELCWLHLEKSGTEAMLLSLSFGLPALVWVLLKICHEGLIQIRTTMDGGRKSLQAFSSSLVGAPKLPMGAFFLGEMVMLGERRTQIWTMG